MERFARLMIGAVAASHLGFLVLEMGLWTHPIGHRIFHTTPAFASASAGLAANQGLYNGFLAAGLARSLWTGRHDEQLFFLGCVIVAGVFGGLTASPSILLVQALPAAIATAALITSRRQSFRSVGSSQG